MKIVQNFKKQLDRVTKKKTPQEIFLKLKAYHLSRVELMIVDSGIKKLPIEHIPETLLLRQEMFHEMLQNITEILKKVT